LIRSVSTVTSARAIASSVFQLFSFLVVCSGMISKEFGFMAFFASVKASSVCIHLSCNQLDATYYFIVLLIGSICFGHYYAYHQNSTESCYNLQPGHYSKLPAPSFQPTTTQERDDQCGNQHYSRELLMMGLVVLETC